MKHYLMEQRQFLFTLSFMATLGLLLFFLGSSITGQVVQTMYCDNATCYDFCTAKTDCLAGEICCQEQTFGLCKDSCETEFNVDIKYEGSYPFPKVDSPAPQVNTVLYGVLAIITLIIGAIYFFFGGKVVHIKVR